MSTLLDIEKAWNPTSTATRDLRPGYTVRVHQKIIEGKKERVQIFEGLIINVSGRSGINQTIRVRRVASGVGVERVFPVASPRIEQIEVVRKAKVRRANLTYMRSLTGKGARLKEEMVGGASKASKRAAAAAAALVPETPVAPVEPPAAEAAA